MPAAHKTAVTSPRILRCALDNAFAERWMITSARTSRVYTRTMLLNAAMRATSAKAFQVSRKQIAAMLDDTSFMYLRRGMVPSAIITDAIYAVVAARAE